MKIVVYDGNLRRRPPVENALRILPVNDKARW